ncbi:MAG TPA: amidohydrolase family protein [Vicinamibacterales bacterium]|nr:amidohydrolase family protein [Vicinamibacterales bacterium]
MKKLLFIAFAALALLTPERPVAQTQAPTARAVAIRGGTVLTVTGGTIPNGVVVLRNGRIEAVGGTNTPIPAGAETIDASGRFVSPGIIDAHSHIAAESINEGGTTVSSMTGIEDVLNPTDINIFRDLAGGLTVANVLHGSANPIGGTNAVIKLRWGKARANELLFEGALPGIKFALGENPKDMRFGGGQQNQPPRRYPATRPGVEYVIRDAFTRAKAYQREWQEYEKRRASDQTALAPRRDLQLEPLVEILEGKRLVHAHCYRADEILMLIRLADEMGFKIATFQHVLEGFKVADEIAAHGAGASTFSDWWAYKVEAEDATPYNAALMHERGVLVSINSDSAEHARRLNTEAAKSIHWGGLSDDEALALVTINPAKQLRIDDRVGSLEPGKDADVVIWNNHPLSNYAIADRVYIDGQMYYDRLEDERRLTDARSEKTRLAAAEGRTSPTAEPQTSSPRPQVSGAGPQSEQHDQGLGGIDESRLPQPAATTGPVTAITNARIHPITQPMIERGTIVMRGGRIEAVGANVQVPAGAQVIDAQGADVYPGFVDGRTSMGLSEPGPRGFDDVQEMLDINAAVRANVGYRSDSDAIAVARVNGVTTVGVMPAGGLLGGQAAIMNLDGWTWEEATLKPTAGVTFQFPNIGGGGGFGGDASQPPRKYEELKRERDARVKIVEELVARAKAYARIPAADRRTDWNLEAMVPVVEGRQPLFVQAGNEAQIREAVAFADRTGLRVVITGGIEAPLVAPLLKEKNIPVLLGSVLTLPSREDLHHAAAYKAAGELAEAGVKFGFATGSYQNVRLLPYEAAISVAWGLPRDQALRALTIDTADILGVADQVGSIEPGKVANLVIWQGDPLELRTPVPRVFIAGRDVGPLNKHLELYERFGSRPMPTRAQ